MDIIAERLTTIQTKIRQVEHQKLQCQQMLGLFWEHPPALDPEDDTTKDDWPRKTKRRLPSSQGRKPSVQSHVGLDLVEMGKPAETVVRLPEVVEQKIYAYLELIGEELVVATLTGWGVGTFIGAVGKNTGLFLFSIVRKRSLVSHVPYVPSRYSHDSPLHLFSATVGSDLSRVRSLHSTRSLSFKGIPFLAMKSICASAVLTYEQAVQGLTWRTAFLTEE
ncbi:hypothetical protein Tco_0993489 [Tanacetum coccineum]